MKTIQIRLGLDIPMAGQPAPVLCPAPTVRRVALVGEDYVGLKPTMLVAEGDRVKLGQPVLRDKKNPGVNFTAPGCGRVVALNRGPKRRFDSLVIELDGEEEVRFTGLEGRQPSDLPSSEIRATLQESGLWTGLRQRPFGRIPAADSNPASLFVTATDTNPLAPDPALVIDRQRESFDLGLAILRQLVDGPIHLCLGPGVLEPELLPVNVRCWRVLGPHPAGLPSTHIHHIDPVSLDHTVWHIGYQEVMAIGTLFATGGLERNRTISIAGVGVKNPALYSVPCGAALADLTHDLVDRSQEYRVVAGSILHGRSDNPVTGFLGRHHVQVSVLLEDSGRALFGWLHPGRQRFSATRLFLSAFLAKTPLPLSTALWGGKRAIFPLGSYEKVMPLDIIATSLLKSLAVADTEKAAALGCLELVEEDLALCTYVCPGKNDFGPMLRTVLDGIERDGV